MLLSRPEMLGPREDHLDMTAMVDVVFQLMAFLLLTFQATVVVGVDVPQAKHGRGIEEAEAVILVVAPPETPRGQARVYEGTEANPESLLATPDAITAAVQKGLDEGRKNVVLEAGGDVPHGEVLRIAGVVAQVPGIVLHIGVEEAETP